MGEKIGTVFGKHEITFPVNSDLLILFGKNGTGKTQVLNLLANYYEEKGENVVHFKSERKYQLSQDEVESIYVMHELTDSYNWLKYFLDSLDIQLNPWDFELIKKGELIHDGFMHIVDILATLSLVTEKSIVLIDNFEKGIHPSLYKPFLEIIRKLSITKKLIVTTYKVDQFGHFSLFADPIEKYLELK